MDDKTMRFSKQASGALMMALQRCIMDQSDMVGIIDNFELKDTEDGLIILNPPIVETMDELDEDFDEEDFEEFEEELEE